MSSLRVGFVGTGTMGGAMVLRLLEREVDVLVHDLDADAARPLLEAGARWSDSLADLAARCDVLLLSLPGPPQVESVVEGLLPALTTNATIVDLSTSAVATARTLAARCADRGVGFLDAPVSGGSAGALAGTLVLMVGGAADVLERVRPVLEPLSRSIFHLGPPGAGTVAKLVNNQLYLGGQVLFFEGLALAAKAELDLGALVEILDQTGAGGVHARLADRVFERRFDDGTFALALAEKDLALMLEAGDALDVPLPATDASHRLFREAFDAGLRDENFWAAIELVEARSQVRISRGEPEE